MNEFGELRLKFTSSEPLKYGANAAAEFDEPDWPRFVRITDVDEHGRLRDDTFRSLPPEIAKPYELQEGDLLLARSGATVGKSFIYEKDWGAACYAGYLIRLRVSKKFDARYLYWYFQSGKYWADINSNLIQSTIQNVSADRYANFRIPTPLLETQRRIAKFLDAKTARIDALIEKKRALLDRLAEKRQALITHAVTKGLDPNAPMKDSGIDWLGEIPVHWEVRGLTKCTTRVDYRGATPQKMPSGVFLVTARNIRNGCIDYEASQEFIADEDYEHVMRRGKPLIGEILLTTEAPLGEIARVDREDIALAQRVIKFASSVRGLLNSYLAYWLQSGPFRFDLLSRATGSTALGIKASKIVELRCLIPSVDEQERIVSHLERITGAIDSVRDKIGVSTMRLNEYRSALITAAVTGKLGI